MDNITIKVRFFSVFRSSLNDLSSVEIETKRDISIKGFLETLSGRYGPDFRGLIFEKDTGEVRGDILILINGTHCPKGPGWENRPLKDGDEAALFQAVDGG